MNRFCATIFCSAFAALAQDWSACAVLATPASPVIVNPANGHRYVLLNNNTWTASESEAVSMGGHLATIDNQAEEDWIFNTFGHYGGQNRLLWIGLNDAMAEGKFVWSSAEPVVFTAWAAGEPNSILAENYTAIYYPGHSTQNQWNDWGNITADPVGLPFNGVVEIDPGVAVATIVPLKSVWKYLSNGSDQGTAWNALNFDDSTWPSGTAQLGYGDGDESTVLDFGGNAANKFITTYFRRSFVVTNLDAAAHVYVRLLRDDGAVVYLNGVEVYRSNLPTGTIGYRTLASAAVSGVDESTGLHFRTVPASALREGTNVVAVEMHQSSADSSDLSFDLELNLKSNAAPAITICAPEPGAILATPGKISIGANAADDDQVTNVQFFVNGTRLGERTNAPYAVILSNAPAGLYELIAVATDNNGLSTTSAPVHVSVQPALVARGSIWKYFDKGVDLGTSWRARDFDDTAWASGAAQLGYGDGDEATVVSYGPDQNNKYITIYFRERFQIGNPAIFTNLLFRLLSDDGAVVYLNGNEIFRSNMPGGNILFSTLASASVNNADESTFYTVAASASSLLPGTNVLAVEIHQSATNSSDVSFDLELIGLRLPDPPLLSISRSADNVLLSWPATASDFNLESTVALGTGAIWRPTAGNITTNNGSVQAVLLGNDPQRFFRLRKN
jgi:hypothetical protein